MAAQGNAAKGLRMLAIDSVLVGALTILTGIVLVAAPQPAGSALCFIIGFILVFVGVAMLVGVAAYGGFLSGYSALMGIALVLLGAFCVVKPALVMGIINVLLGLFIVLDAGNSFVNGVRCVKAKVKGGGALVAASAVLALCGVMIMFGPYETATAILGWVLVIDGVADIVITLVLGKKIRQTKAVYGRMRQGQADVIEIEGQ